ncbi:MAG: diguanylate cyclase [Pseudomonadota bacterium]
MLVRLNKLDLFSYGLDRDVSDGGVYRSLYILNAAFFIAFFASIILSVFYQWVSATLVWLHLVSAFTAVGLIGINVKLQDPKLSGRLGAAFYFVFLFVTEALMGGIHSASLAWFIVVPLVAGMAVGTRDAAFWTAATLLAMASLYFIDALDIYRGPGVAAERRAFTNLFLLSANFLVLGAIVVTSLTRYRILEQQLANSICRQELEAKTASVLSDIAAAANEELNFDDAGRECLRILCSAESWQAGRLWSVRTSELSVREIWYFENPNEMTNKLASFNADLDSSELARRAMQTGFSILLSDRASQTEQWENSFGCLLGMRSHFAWPVFVEGEVVAVIEIFSNELMEYDQRTDHLLSFTALQLSHVKVRERSQEKIDNLAFYDPLTGMPNRHTFLGHLTEILDIAKQDGELGALVFVDIEGLRRINNAFDHAVGDGAIRLVARRVERTAQQSNLDLAVKSFAARVDGDEFAIALLGFKDQATVERESLAFAEKLTAAFEFPQAEVNLTVHAGIVMFPQRGVSAKDLLRLADAAALEAKTHIQNNHCFASSEHHSVLRRRALIEKEILAGDFEKNLLLDTQPIVSARNFDMVSWQATPKWRVGEVDHNITEFLEAADSLGQLSKIGERVAERFCQIATDINDSTANRPPTPICLDVNSTLIRSNDFLVNFKRFVAHEDIDASCIWLQLNEELSSGDTSRFIERMAFPEVKLIATSFDICHQLSTNLPGHFPMAIKINTHKLIDSGDYERSMAIFINLVTMAHRMNLQVIADDIASETHAKRVKQIGCNYLQGPFISNLIGHQSSI